MKRSWVRWSLSIACLAVSCGAWAQTVDRGSVSSQTAVAPPPYAAQTGDAWLDARLKDLNAYAPRYPDAFVDEIARYLDVPRGYVVALGQQPGWAPGDVYFACALAKALARPCREVVRARARDDEDGWRGVAERLAPEQRMPVQALRSLLRTSYAHWARPLD